MTPMTFIRKVKNNLWILRSLPKTVYFNFHYLPFAQAVKLPIILRKPKFSRLAGKIILDVPHGKRFRILIGGPPDPGRADLGVRWEVTGTVIFKGRCRIGNDSVIHVLKNGTLIFGDHFINSCGMLISSMHHIEFKENVLVGFDNMIMDHDGHALKKVAATSGGGTHQNQRLRCDHHRQKLLDWRTLHSAQKDSAA